jgi:hypothetical protein
MEGLLSAVKKAAGSDTEPAPDSYSGDHCRECFDELVEALGVEPKDPDAAYSAFCELVADLAEGGGTTIVVK